MIIIIGGIIVASVLVFIIILMIRYKVYSNQGTGQGKVAIAAASSRPQSNGQGGGGQVQVLPRSASKMADSNDDQAIAPSRAMSPSNTLRDTVALVEEESSGRSIMTRTDSTANEDLLSPTKARFSSRVAIEMKSRPPSVAKEPTSPKDLAGSRATDREEELDKQQKKVEAFKKVGRKTKII